MKTANVTINRYDTAPEWWDQEVASHEGLFCSSSAWADFYKHLGIGRGLYYEVLVDNRRMLLVLVYEVLIGGPLLLFLPKIILSVLFQVPFLRSFNMHLQPVIVERTLLDNTGLLLNLSERFIERLLRDAKTSSVNIKPADYICFRDIRSAIELNNIKYLTAKTIGTTRIKLNTPLDTFYSNLHESAKSGVRKCQSLEVAAEYDVIGDVFYSELKKSWEGNNLAVNHGKYYLDLIKTNDQNIKYILAKYNNKIVAGSGIMCFGTTIMEFSMFITKYARDNKIPAGDFIKWEIIKYGINNRCVFVDLNMISVDNGTDKKIRDINFYKLKWGGDMVYGISISQLNTFLKLVSKVKKSLMGI